jgi:uncharacterized metal-binding protein YceD (DUF177 family)
VREQIFGATLDASARCPCCEEPVEFTLQTTELGACAPADREESYELAEDGVAVKFRVPNSVDLRAIADCGDVATARGLLLDRCILEKSGEALTEPLIAKLAARLSECDPLAEITLVLHCAACGHPWRVTFDIATFLWSEIDALAKRLMVEVQTLARAYGWSEDDILAMGAARRQFYLEMAG